MKFLIELFILWLAIKSFNYAISILICLFNTLPFASFIKFINRAHHFCWSSNSNTIRWNTI